MTIKPDRDLTKGNRGEPRERGWGGGRQKAVFGGTLPVEPWLSLKGALLGDVLGKFVVGVVKE